MPKQYVWFVWENADVVGVFSSFELAEAYATKRRRAHITSEIRFIVAEHTPHVVNGADDA